MLCVQVFALHWLWRFAAYEWEWHPRLQGIQNDMARFVELDLHMSKLVPDQ